MDVIVIGYFLMIRLEEGNQKLEDAKRTVLETEDVALGVMRDLTWGCGVVVEVYAFYRVVASSNPTSDVLPGTNVRSSIRRESILVISTSN